LFSDENQETSEAANLAKQINNLVETLTRHERSTNTNGNITS
jgi:hypothetical protein